ncbi:exodeoxyribonuclease V subunit alpha [Candidatus Photodesmus anomalopis]|uniref:RecBCD enzyme subunit RecD n=1 Tax=Candidatus Photodesmus katoptron Akat1 TaxID=1236703 RepID=S3DL56_9GAMM|nr:exodeoxyribonuclease V subunit alpha [Candidatus Photodesmus katoptron]EPE37874.1 exodeoxyribonuclease V alpha chain [Candidatus Photodesmus katoptron Akat1]
MEITFLDVLKLLSEKGLVRLLDYQFARFMSDQVYQNSDEIAFISALLSYELGQGNVCLLFINDKGEKNLLDVVSKFNLSSDIMLQLNKKILQTDWSQIIKDCYLIGFQDESHPLIFDGLRLYLQRYWQYEYNLALCLTNFSVSRNLQYSELKLLGSFLDQIIYRDYDILFHKLSKLSCSIQRKKILYEYLDVISFDRLNWKAIEKVLINAIHAEDLKVLDTLIPQSSCLNWQKVAAAIALTRNFLVISGGPGTGKTTTVTQLLAVLIYQFQQKAITPIIKLVAPTGKASAHLTQSIGVSLKHIVSIAPELKGYFPTEASTLHALLGMIPNSVNFYHNQRNPINVDILVVDEASMVDLSMMFNLLNSIPKHARLILLGDKDQLSSVEAGSVLGDVCSFYQYGFSYNQAQLIATLTGYSHKSFFIQNVKNKNSISDSLCMLTKNYRFDSCSGIGQLAKAVNFGEISKVESILKKKFTDIRYFSIKHGHYNHILRVLVREYGTYLKSLNQFLLSKDVGKLETQKQEAKKVLKIFSRCRLLCAVRMGDFGVVTLNKHIEYALISSQLIQIKGKTWYHGRPIMITKNDYELGLFNGDIGICICNGIDVTSHLRVFFELPDGNIRSFSPNRLPEHETAYAMTIHKSQGSEFDLVLMVLPLKFSKILTKELVYTGITRAKSSLFLYASMSILKRSINTKIQRSSGLVNKLKKLNNLV